nr:hypothetical protein [Legionella sp.]
AKALEEEKKLQKEKEKIARQQAVIDSITQISSILTAGATLFAKGAFSGPVGIATASVTIIGMIASFLALRNKLKSSGFKDGVIDLQGPGTATSDSIDARLSKGESVMTARETRDNMSLLKGIRNKDNRLIEIGISNLLKNSGVILSSDMPQELSGYKSALKNAEMKAYITSDNSGVESRIESVESRLLELIKVNKENTTILPNGDMIIKKGNSTTIIKRIR